MTSEACAAIIVALLCNPERETKRKRKQYWMKDCFKRRAVLQSQSLRQELSADISFLQMEHSTFFDLLEMVTPLIQKETTVMREAISAAERLSTTLRFLATGQSFEGLKSSTAIAPQTIGSIVMETCNAIIKVLKKNIKLPDNESGWKEVAAEFGRKWNYPHCLGAIGGKHIQIRKPAESSSHYLNYKNTFSVVLTAVVNANYEFTMVDVGANGSRFDGGRFVNTTFYRKLMDEELKIPKPEAIPDFDIDMPYVFVADDAFPLMDDIMTPYPSEKLQDQQQSTFNYRLFRCHRVVENALGVMSSRFKVLLSTINLSPDKANAITLTCCHLHNYLQQRAEQKYVSGGFDEEDTKAGTIECGDWRSDQNQLMDLESDPNRDPEASAEAIRNNYCQYFNTTGAVPWQSKFAEINDT